MEHFITKIQIRELRHLSNITIQLNQQSRQHLMITGKNGSGKTSFLIALQECLMAIETGERLNEFDQQMHAFFNEEADLNILYESGKFVIAFFPADRKIQILRANGVEDIKLKKAYDIDESPSVLLHKYMVHLKTQQAYARNEGNEADVDRIQNWFDRFVGALRILLEDDSLTLEYDYRTYDFRIHEDGRKPFGLNVLSDGYSSVLHVVSDLMLRMDKDWLFQEGISEYNVEGIVLIDELETHLHIELQKKIMPFLTEFFPRIQFIVTTHSPYILNSISNAKAYDLENCIELENLSLYSSDGLAEGYFGADEYADELKEKLNQYQYLAGKTNPTEEERAHRAMLRMELKNIPKGMSAEARDKFEEIEGMRL